MKLIGYLHDVPVYEEPTAPAGTLFVLTQDNEQRTRMVPISPWQRFLVTLKRMFKNGRL